MWNASHPEIKEIDISISGLPGYWKDKKIVQLSDVHLGVINGPGFMTRVAEKVNSIEPDLVVITGDLFDGMGGGFSSFIQPLKSIKAEKGVFFVTGNHEGYLGLDKPLSTLRKTGIRILENEVAEIEGLQIVGLGFPEFNKANGLKKIFEGPDHLDRDKPNILLYHTPTDIGENHLDMGDQQANTYWNPDTGLTTAKNMGIDLQLSGHTHAGQFFPFTWIAQRIYQEYNYGLHGDGTFQIYVSSGVGTWGPPLRLGSPSEIVLIRLKQIS
jgi:predicted MPP superfamily phosphohydrolase